MITRRAFLKSGIGALALLTLPSLKKSLVSEASEVELGTGSLISSAGNGGTSGSFVDEAGNVISSVSSRLDDKLTTEIYVNGELDHIVVHHLGTGLIQVTSYVSLQAEAQTSQYSVESMISPQTVTLGEICQEEDAAQPTVELPNSANFNTCYSFTTDYVYNGSILTGTTYSAGYELSSSSRYDGYMIQIDAGTAVGVLVSLLLAYFGGGISVSTVKELGISTVSGVIVSSLSTTVCFTYYRVVTKVYFNGIYTVLAGKSYDKVLVNSGGSGNSFSTGYYGYDIVYSWASTCCSGGAKAFSDKYITLNNSSLSLPITTIPYYG